MRFNEFSDVVTYFKTVMTKKRNRKYHAMVTLFDIMRLIRRGKLSIKRFPKDVINNIFVQELVNFQTLCHCILLIILSF